MFRYLLVALVAALSVLASPLAAAAGEAAVEEGGELKQKAQELLKEGNRLARQGDFGNALVKFHAAYELFPSPKLLLNIGTSLRHIGRYAEAAAVYERYLEDPQADPEQREQLGPILEELEDSVGRLEIELAEPGLRVSLDGHVLQDVSDELALRVDPGPHTLTAEKEGRPPTVRHVNIRAQQTVKLVLSVAEPGEPPPEPVPVRSIVGYSMAGLGGAGLVVGIIVGGVALSTAADAREQCPNEGEFAGYCTEEGNDLGATARGQGTASAIILVGSAALVGAGLAIAWTDDSEEEEGSVVGRLMLGPNPGVRLEVRW